jgi:hypothetical protein
MPVWTSVVPLPRAAPVECRAAVYRSVRLLSIGCAPLPGVADDPLAEKRTKI